MGKALIQQWVNTTDGWKSRGRTKSSNTSTDWSDSNVPWAYTGATQTEREAEFFANYPSGWSMPTIVDIQTGAATFRQNVLNTITANGRCIIRLGEGTYHLTSFVKAAADEMYAFGLWHTNLAGFVGQGADKTIIQMDANSMNATQLAGIPTLTSSNINQLNVMRLDGEASTPAVLAGLTIQAEDQQIITSFDSSNSIAGNQPAPHGGIMWYRRGVSSNVYFYCSHVRARGAGRACTSLPPFEHANFGSQYEYGYYYNTESDGRRASSIDAAQPRRCGVVMGNNAQEHSMVNCWVHHSNVSRYAVNDQNADTSGSYTVAYCKFDHITDTQNVDPALNGGASLGGYTNATPLGWESCNGTITVHHTIISQSNPYTNIQIAQMFQMTSVGARNPQGGRFYAYDNTYINTAWPQLDGYCAFRIAPTTYWWTDGFANTIDVRATQGGPQLTAYQYSGTWPPTAGQLSAAGVSPTTHYIVRST